MKKKDQQFYLVDLKILPEAIKKTIRVKEMLQDGTCGSIRECKIVCVNRYCMNLLYAPYWGKQR